ncbi:hypothetical protein E2C01_002453 [Portunus trituberculatus]|uniref:Uncharacterized protein n=1 Tax=Portunus trituberculatus TaxID=210409 RepID=A0A5B7CNA4_PORTR|nr:hypothetical protein [Portunus trituberculatus]
MVEIDMVHPPSRETNALLKVPPGMVGFHWMSYSRKSVIGFAVIHHLTNYQHGGLTLDIHDMGSVAGLVCCQRWLRGTPAPAATARYIRSLTASSLPSSQIQPPRQDEDPPCCGINTIQSLEEWAFVSVTCDARKTFKRTLDTSLVYITYSDFSALARIAVLAVVVVAAAATPIGGLQDQDGQFVLTKDYSLEDGTEYSVKYVKPCKYCQWKLEGG